jgi:23S rRNA (uracil1939-C5)-methyltransferase
MKLKKNEIYEIKIEDLTNLGFGVGKIDSTAVFVADTVIGDVVKCKIIKIASSYAVGKAVEIVSRSESFCSNRCTNKLCHSCAYKNVSEELEGEIKRKNVAFELQKAGIRDVKVNRVVTSPKSHGYRNKAQYPVSINDGKALIGFYAPKSHRVTEGADCPLSPTVFGDILERIREFLLEFNISSYDEESGKGLLRHIYLRRAEATEEILVTLVVNGFELPHSEELVERLTSEFPRIVGILLNSNTKCTNVIL